MLDNYERRTGAMANGNYWSAIINPALMNFNDFSNFYMYHNLAAMQHHYQQQHQQQQQQQEMFRQHFGNCFCDKKRQHSSCDSESPKPKRQKVSEPQNSGKSKQQRAPTASLIILDSPEDLRAETTTPNSNKSGLITFRPHSDILTSCLETRASCSKNSLLRKKSENGDSKKVEMTTLPTLLSKNNLSNLLSTSSDVWEEGDGAICRLFPEILSIIFQYLDITSKGRVAQVKTFADLADIELLSTPPPSTPPKPPVEFFAQKFSPLIFHLMYSAAKIFPLELSSKNLANKIKRLKFVHYNFPLKFN